MLDTVYLSVWKLRAIKGIEVLKLSLVLIAREWGWKTSIGVAHREHPPRPASVARYAAPASFITATRYYRNAKLWSISCRREAWFKPRRWLKNPSNAGEWTFHNSLKYTLFLFFRNREIIIFTFAPLLTRVGIHISKW